MVSFPTEPYQWRKDPRCYVSNEVFDPTNTTPPPAQVLKWRKPRHFLGYLYTTFEGWEFASAKRTEDPSKLSESRYYAEIYYDGQEIPFAPEPRTYWVTFTGREAYCNAQSPDDAQFGVPNSPNAVVIDHLEKAIRVP
jgi:hypothetical protein